MKRILLIGLLVAAAVSTLAASTGDYRQTPTPEDLLQATKRRNRAYLAELAERRRDRQEIIARFAAPGPGDMRAIDSWGDYAGDKREELVTRLGGCPPPYGHREDPKMDRKDIEERLLKWRLELQDL